MLRVPAHFGKQNNPPEPDARLKANFGQKYRLPDVNIIVWKDLDPGSIKYAAPG